MKAMIWGVFVLLAGLWTALVAASAALVDWVATAMGSGRVGELASGAADWPVPAWLKALQASGVVLVQWLAERSPSLSGVLDWLTPLMWMVWGLVFVVIFVAALALHWLVGRLNGPTLPQRVPA